MALLILAISSCATLPEETFYADATPNGATVTHIYSTDVSYIGQAAWDNIREGMVCMSPQAVGDIKAFIEEVCSEVSCSEQTTQIMSKAYNRIMESRSKPTDGH